MIRHSIACSLVIIATAGCVHRSLDDVRSTEATPTVVQLERGTQSWDGALLPAYPEGQPEVTILHISIPPGIRLPLHTHPVINAGVLLEGQLTVISETGERLELQAGDSIIELVNSPHYGVNEGDNPAIIIVFYAGIEGRPVTKPIP